MGIVRKKKIDSFFTETKKVKSATTQDSPKPSKGKDSRNSYAFKDKTKGVNQLNLPARKKDKRKEKIELLWNINSTVILK